MIPKEHVSLAPFTTFHIGGEAQFFIEALTQKDIEEAIAFARDRHLPLCILGGGSNVLIPDEGIEGVVLRIMIGGSSIENDGDDVMLVAGAGVSWNNIVDMVGARGIFGIENLAGIPGTLGGAAVQNVGAYGAEFSTVFEYADTLHRLTGERRRITRSAAQFAYRTSLFKKDRDLIITQVGLRFKRSAKPGLSYSDLALALASGESLATPVEIARAVRAIRARKFPDSTKEGTAGSFFKNPVVSKELSDSLVKRFPRLPTFPQQNAEAKISLAWLLDHALSLKGYEVGNVRLYEKQPLVIVAQDGATAAEVGAFADGIAERVLKAAGITLEREVETFGGELFS